LYEHKIFTQGVIWKSTRSTEWASSWATQLAKAILAELQGAGKVTKPRPLDERMHHQLLQGEPLTKGGALRPVRKRWSGQAPALAASSCEALADCSWVEETSMRWFVLPVPTSGWAVHPSW